MSPATALVRAKNSRTHPRFRKDFFFPSRSVIATQPPPLYGNRFLGCGRDVRATNDIFRKSIEEFAQINVVVLDISLSEHRALDDVNSDVLVGGNCDGLGSEDGCFLYVFDDLAL